ncbi:MAG: hypothetical protein AAFO62_02340, partial [Pseudomonadota bacterium]
SSASSAAWPSRVIGTRSIDIPKPPAWPDIHFRRGPETRAKAAHGQAKYVTDMVGVDNVRQAQRPA